MTTSNAALVLGTGVGEADAGKAGIGDVAD
jgi:hypothetical protein